MNAQLLAKLRREYVRQAIRDGKTIAQTLSPTRRTNERTISTAVRGHL